jgi:dCTP deaminase
MRNPRFMINPFDKSKEIINIAIPESGLILSPYIGYLGNTVEYTETHNLFPYIDGKSSLGRNFMLVHFTAGRGDDGFCGQWTLEINCVYPMLVKKGMRCGQIYYEESIGARKPYDKNPLSHYNGQCGPTVAAAVAIECLMGR